MLTVDRWGVIGIAAPLCGIASKKDPGDILERMARTTDAARTRQAQAAEEKLDYYLENSPVKED